MMVPIRETVSAALVNGTSPVKVNVHYPKDKEYDYFVTVDILNLNDECYKDLSNCHGLVLKESQSINRALKSEYSIFSSRFGKSLQDENPYTNRYKCKYGCTEGAFFAVNHEGWNCPYCHTEVKMVGDDFTFFGWNILKRDYHVISPIMYMELVSLIGKDNLETILEPEVELDINGNPMSSYDKKIFKRKNARRYKKKGKIDTKYEGLGMIGFYEKFDEVIHYFYSKKKSTKKEVYELIMEHRDCVFTNCLPVYTTQLRIIKVDGKRFTFEKTNAAFNMITNLTADINRDDLSIYKNRKLQNQLLWDIQVKVTELSDEIIRILADKRGTMRSTISGRTSFSERSVIVPEPTLKMDEVSLPYTGLVLLLEQVLVNILQSSYNITYAAAYKIWYYSTLQMDERVLSILNNLIHMDKIHVLINRNPTIHYQSIVWKRVVKVNTDSMVMSMDLYTLTGLAADQFSRRVPYELRKCA